ncbi:MAG: NADP-dependent oxidoreductase [Gammaproteobacteria bacterium]
MCAELNRQWRLAARPMGNVKPSDFSYVEAPIPEPAEGEFLLQTMYLGVVPVMRMYMLETGGAGEMILNIGDLIHGRGVGRIIQSRHPDYQQGEIVQGQIGWQTYHVTRAAPQERYFKCRDYDLSWSLAAGVLGMTGLSAWGGFFNCAKPKPGDVVVVSAAAGGVGSLVIQLAKIAGCRVIGITGSQKKCDFVKQLACDEAIDYKTEDVAAKLAEYCPAGIDIYFDNVGGDILGICLEQLAFEARIVLCGSISEYLADERPGLKNYTRLRSVNGSMHGFFVYNYAHQFYQATDELAAWIKTGQLEPVQDMMQGFENMPAALAGLYTGNNVGVQCCTVREE